MYLMYDARLFDGVSDGTVYDDVYDSCIANIIHVLFVMIANIIIAISIYNYIFFSISISIYIQ